MFNYFKLTKKARFYGLDTRGEDHGNRGGLGGGSRRKPDPPAPPPIPSNIENSNLVLPDKEILLTRKDKYYRVYKNGKYYKCYGLKSRLNATTVFNMNLFNKFMYKIILNKNLVVTMAKDRSYIRVAPLPTKTDLTFQVPATGNYTLRLNDTLTDNQDKNLLKTKELTLNAGDNYTLQPYKSPTEITTLVFTINDLGKAKGGIK